MGLFDKIGKQVGGSVNQASRSAVNNTTNSAVNNATKTATQTAGQFSRGATGKGTQSLVFQSLPATLAEFQTLPQAQMQSPYETAAMFVVALSIFPQNRDASVAMINFLKGPEQLNLRELSFLKEQVTAHLSRSYFAGATPQNDYAPSQPYTVVVSDNSYSFPDQTSAKLLVQCGGADSPRPISLRLAKDGKWYLWDHTALLSGIRQPESSNPWA